MTKAKRDPRVYLTDILSAINRIQEYTADGKDAFFEDEKTQDAVIRQLSIIGEAAAKLPPAIRAADNDIPWKEIIGMRNIIIHDYAETDISTVWVVVERDLPHLQMAVNALLEREAA